MISIVRHRDPLMPKRAVGVEVAYMYIMQFRQRHHSSVQV